MGVLTDEHLLHCVCGRAGLGVSKMIQRRFEVWDELGRLRSFYTRAEAEAFILPGMELKVLPREKKPKPRHEDLEDLVGLALF